ncbi:MAG: DNA polymerase/3'-5' exonuclease PolX [Acidimicrobiia bacterium]|jgi:DNA polymerase (family 10)
MSRNREVARVLGELAALLVLDEQSRQAFRVRAYEKAQQAVAGLDRDVASMSDGELLAVDGLGKGTVARIREYLDTGSIARLDELRLAYPPSVVELTRIPGLGPKSVHLLRERLGVESVADLEQAIAANALRDLPGMGARSEGKIAGAVARLGLHGKDRRTPIAEALPIARELVAALREVPAVRHVTYCGSLRRFRETIGDVDIVVASTRPGAVMDAFVALPQVQQVLVHGDTKTSILTAGGIQVDLRVVAPSQLGAALVYFTGSKEHNIELRQRAIDRGLLLNEYALSDGDRVVGSRTEKAVYRGLGLPFIAPELREGHGEVAAAAEGSLPRLVTEDDIRGDLHVHSTWSGDGRSALEDMVAAAAGRGLAYVAITEHGEDLTINGLSREEVGRERRIIEELRGAYPGLHILHGAELNIGPDGSLDYDTDFLLGLDWGVASVHSHFDLPQARQTERVLAAMAHPAVNVIGHLTGRRIGHRPGIDLDPAAVFAAAADTGTALEINCHLDRLDIPADLLRQAAAVDGVRFLIDTDAHHTSELANVTWGVAVARRGWVDKATIANTWPADRFLAWARSGRSS